MKQDSKDIQCVLPSVPTLMTSQWNRMKWLKIQKTKYLENAARPFDEMQIILNCIQNLHFQKLLF